MESKKRLTAADLVSMGVKVFRVGDSEGTDYDVYYGIDPDYAVDGWMACNDARWEFLNSLEAAMGWYDIDSEPAQCIAALLADINMGIEKGWGRPVDPIDDEFNLDQLAAELNA